MTAFVDVLLRAAILVGQAAAIGGVAFAVLVLPSGSDRSRPTPGLVRVLALLALGATAAAAAQVLSVATLLGSLADESGWPAWRILTTSYFQAGVVKISACLGLIGGCVAARRRPAAPGPKLALLAFALLLAAGAAWTSHAAARLGQRGLPLALETVHQLAAATWIGGLLHLAVTAFRDREQRTPPRLLKRFSTVAGVSVATLIAAGVGLAVHYIDGLHALLGTAYGVMVLTKVTILGGLVALGAANFLTVRRLPDSGDVSPQRLRRFVEVELGLGITVLFVAASLTSLPPAVDVVTDRATLAEVSTRFTPRWPTFSSPPIEALPVGDRDAPRTDEDRAWSEFNHHVSGLLVLSMGLLASLERFRDAQWARHWPLVFLGLAGFMMVRNDPGAWPLGPRGFWESMTEPAALQHRVFVLLVVAFAVFEWQVRTGRLRAPRYALVFPLLCAVGGGLLLAHSHASLNLKSEFLIEVTHAPLGVLGILVGWARWLELRLPPPGGRIAGRLSASALALVGVLLLFYRES